MPSGQLTFRVSCGTFHAIYINFMWKRAARKAAMRVALLTPRGKLDGFFLGLTLSYLFWGGLLLLRSGDVEPHPGPPAPPGKDAGKDAGTLKAMLTSTTHHTRSRAGSASADRVHATTSSSTRVPPDKEPSRAELMDVLQNVLSTMNCKFDNVEKKFDDLGEKCSALQSDVRNLRDEVGDLKKENEVLTKANAELLSKVEQLERKTDDLEGRSKRNNLIFYGISRDQNETNDDCEGKVHNLLMDKLNVTKKVEFDRVHRLSAKPDSPIIVRCTFYKDKVNILREKKNLKGSNVFVGEDFSFNVREIRRGLSPHLKKARSEGKRATMIYDHLVIDGKSYFLDGHGRLKDSR